MDDHTLSSAPETALAARVEAAAEVEASHGPDRIGFACRGCGWAYVGEINACPPVLMARAGLPELAGTITYGGGPVECMADALTDQIGELSALVNQLREDVWAVHDTADEVLGEVLPGRAGLLPWPGWRRAGLAAAHLVGGVGVAVLLARVLWPALPPLSAARLGLLAVLLTAAATYVQGALDGVVSAARSGLALLQARLNRSSLPPVGSVEKVGSVEPAAVVDAPAGVR